uniref:hypothetical protein n=1 Tax=Malassezia equina TaxID=1381935 RepID=UPI003002B0B9|nr:hypothetical protein [Malassezia equina]
MVYIVEYYINKYEKYIIHPAWLVGFIDGEGTFSIDILNNQSIALNYQVQLRFILTQHIRDKDLIIAIKEYFNCGTLVKDTEIKIQYRMRSLNDLETKLFPILDKYPLQTQKYLDEQTFRQVFLIIKNGEHLTEKGLDEIRYLKSTMNRGRMKQFKKDFFMGSNNMPL